MPLSIPCRGLTLRGEVLTVGYVYVFPYGVTAGYWLYSDFLAHGSKEMTGYILMTRMATTPFELIKSILSIIEVPLKAEPLLILSLTIAKPATRTHGRL